LGGVHTVVVANGTDARELAEYLHGFCTRGMGQ
jgi:hypothetical protein